MIPIIKIEYLPAAQENLEEIFNYVAKDNKEAALQILDDFDNSITRMEQFQLSGSIPKNDRLERLGYRILIVRNYVVFYVIIENIVEIRRIIHGSRRFEFLI